MLVRVAGVDAIVFVIAAPAAAIAMTGVVFTMVDGNVEMVFGVVIIIAVDVVVAAAGGGDGGAVDVIVMVPFGFIGVDFVVPIMTKSILLSGFDAIETLTSLKRFKWKSNCTSADEK